MEFGPAQFGRLLVIIGVITVILGMAMILLSKVGLFKLPGDIQFGSGNWRVYFPIATSIIISILLTLILWLVSYFRR
jgi:hypothetical protein